MTVEDMLSFVPFLAFFLSIIVAFDKFLPKEKALYKTKTRNFCDFGTVCMCRFVFWHY